MDSDESHFNVSLIVRDSHKIVSTDHSVWRERRAEADSNRGPSAYQWRLTARPNRLTGAAILGRPGEHQEKHGEYLKYWV